MKISFLSLMLIVLFFNSQTFAASLRCSNFSKSILVSAQVKSADLLNPMVDGDIEGYSSGRVIGKRSKNKRWIRFSGLSGLNCLQSITIPGDFQTRVNQTFAGVLDKMCEDQTRLASFRLTCNLK